MARIALVLAATFLLVVAAGSGSTAWADPPTTTTTPAPTAAAPTPTTRPTPTTPTTPTTPAPAAEPESQCSIFDNSTWGACVDEILTALFRSIVVSALNPLLDLLGHTLLSTPDPSSLPRIGELWNSSWQIVLICYTTLVLIAGVLVMGYQTLQTRYTIREVLPRLVVGVVTGAMSMVVATKAIEIANALSAAVMGEGLDPDSTAQALKNIYLIGIGTEGVFEQLLLLAFAAGVIAVLITYIVRLVLTILLVAGAPVLLMGHALPQTEGIAVWWWRAFGGCLAVQVAQSFTLVIALRVLLAPGFTPLGPNGNGMVNLLVGLALVYVLVKEPFWILGSVRRQLGGGRSLIGGLARAYVMGKAFGLLKPARPAVNHPRVRLGIANRGPDPQWPKPIRTWWGVDGQHSPAAMARRMRDWQGIERARRRLVVTPGAARFLQAVAQSPTHDIATSHASGRPAVTTFQPALSDAQSAATPWPRPTAAPVPIRFQTHRPTTGTTERWLHTNVSPASMRFRPATPTPATPVARAEGPVAPIVFRETEVLPAARRARSHAPAPVVFRSEQGLTPPVPRAYPPPASPMPSAPRVRGGKPAQPSTPKPAPARFQAAPRRRRAGGDLR
jgi:hypothetical protein